MDKIKEIFSATVSAAGEFFGNAMLHKKTSAGLIGLGFIIGIILCMLS